MAENQTTVQKWLNEIGESRKREKDFLKKGQNILDIYSGECPDKIPFNILFSNTETLLPAVFSQQPRPIVKRRFSTEESPIVEAGAKASTRILEYLLDTNVDGYGRFEDGMTAVTLDALLPGRGTACVEYEAIISGEPENEEEEIESTEKVEYETICLDPKKWDRVYYGYALKWEDMPWVAYELYLDEEEAEKLFGEKADNLDYTSGEESDDEESNEDKHIGDKETAQIYQIWDKSDKTIKYISPQYKDEYLLEQDDELGITGFFNCPRPLQFIEKPNNLLPTALYTIYENQAHELNVIQGRINKVTKAIKVRGAYDGALGEELEQIMDGTDNEMISTSKGASLLDGGFRNAIWFMPLEELVNVLRELYQARESCKQVIYEITGISDVIRGSSKASETLGAQELKASWGTMRLKRLQKRVQGYARDSLRIMLDVAVNKLSSETWAKITGLPYPTAEQKQQAQQMLNMQKLQFQQQAQQAQMQGQQITPPQPDPKLIQAASSPSWEEILNFLQDDYIRSYKVDIETNSTLEVEATEDKNLVGEFMNAMAQFLNGIGPLVKDGTMPFEAAQAMLTQISRRFRFGEEVEEHLKKMKPPQQEADPKTEQMKKQLQSEAQKLQKEREQFEKEKQQVSEQFKAEQKKAGDDLDNRFNDLSKALMKFDFDKKLAQETIKMQEKIAQIKLDADQLEANEKIKSLIKDSERKTQSMMDKHACNIKEMMSTKEKETSVNVSMPEQTAKSIKINRENGQIVSADVVEIEDEPKI